MNSLEKAKQDLDDAITNVANAAELVADGASYTVDGENIMEVNAEDMKELEKALHIWKDATQNFLSEVKKAGE